jgi:hypothetical protein
LGNKDNHRNPTKVTLLGECLRKMHRLHLWFCLIYSHRLLCCRLCYLPLSKPWHPHQNKLFNTPNIIPNIGISSRHIPNATINVRTYFINLFWWRWWESNPRPEVIHIEGITTILLFIILHICFGSQVLIS